MSPQQIRTQFMQIINKEFPELNQETMEPLVAENLLSPFVVSLPNKALSQAQSLARALFRLRSNPAYIESYMKTCEPPIKPRNSSILMSYDFHWTGHELKLIEVNTNAAFMGLGWYMNLAHGLSSPVKNFTLMQLKADIENEIKLQTGKIPSSIKLAIVDHKPRQQRLFIEFLLYQKVFQSWGWTCDILDVEAPELQNNYDFIYNRHTDFYLSDAVSFQLRNLYTEQRSVLSPHPLEYHLLANKQRMQDWNIEANLDQWGVSSEDREILKKHVPRTFDVAKKSPDEVWAQKKHLFFKPKSAFGSKQSYKGESISKKVFAEIMAGDFIAQELVPPSEIEGSTDSGPQKFKYDLRFYAYQSEIEFVVARLYQGQVTNLKTLWGGFAPVRFEN